jgi:hypothetical protein
MKAVPQAYGTIYNNFGGLAQKVALFFYFAMWVCCDAETAWH